MIFKKYAFWALLASISFEVSASEGDGIFSDMPMRSSTMVFRDAVGGIEDIAAEVTQSASIVGVVRIPVKLEQNVSAVGNVVDEVTTDPIQALADSMKLIAALTAERDELKGLVGGLQSELAFLGEKARVDLQVVEQGAKRVVEKAKVTCGC